jgi:outer membrane protein assembly factor BamE (lipoprotein component of BamABCDE complex)
MAVHRGAVIDVALANSIQPGVDNKASVSKLLGSPTFVDQFQPNSWYYVSRLTRQAALRNPSLKRSLVVNVDPSSRSTPTLGRKRSFFDELFGGIGSVNSIGAPGAGPTDQ